MASTLDSDETLSLSGAVGAPVLGMATNQRSLVGRGSLGGL